MDSDSKDSIKIAVAHGIKEAASKWISKQPFLYVLLIAILVSVFGLAYYDKGMFIPDVLRVGCYSVAVVACGMVASWFAPRLQSVFDSIPTMTRAYQALSESNTNQAESMRILTRFASSLQQSLRGNRMVLIVEGSRIEEALVTSWCMDIIKDFGLDLHVARSYAEAIDNLATACVAIVDVVLPDNDSELRIQELIDMAGCPVIVYSGFVSDPGCFLNAEAVLKKGCEPSAFKSALVSAIRKRIRRFV